MSGSCHTIDAGKRHWRTAVDWHGLANVNNVLARHQPPLCMPRRVPMRLAAAASGQAPTEAAMTGPQAILGRYRAMLHEYRAHKASLGEWISSIRAQHKRQPQLLDAEATGDAALVGRFQQYLMARKRLLAEIPLLREQLEESLQLQQQHHHQSAASSSNYQQHKRPSSSSGAQGSFGVVNANKTSLVSKPQAIGQYFAAVSYRKQHGARTDTSSSSSSSRSEQQPAADQAIPATPNSAQLTVTAVVPAAAAGIAGAPAQSSAPIATAAAAAAKDGTVSHLLESATTSSSPSAGSSRAAAAAIAALNYKKQKQGGGTAASLSAMQQQRPLAVQLVAPPPPPPGYAADGSSAAAPAVVLATVETAKGDVYAGRHQRQLDTDTSLETTLQGVPGGLGSTTGGPMFATAKAVQADAVAITATAAAVSSGESSSSSSTNAAAAGIPAGDAVLLAAARQAAASNAPVGQVVTAKFDVYSGRQRKLQPDAQLDDYFASIEQGHSSQLAAAAAAASGSSSASSGTSMSASSSQEAEAASVAKSSGSSKPAPAQRRTSFSSSDGGLLDIGMPDVLPLPT